MDSQIERNYFKRQVNCLNVVKFVKAVARTVINGVFPMLDASRCVMSKN